MTKNKFATLALLIAAIFSRPCFPASFDYSPIGNGNYLLNLVGEIKDGDNARLKALIASRPEKFLGTTSLSLHSPGGSVLEAINIANTIHASGIGIIVEGDQVCASSCFLIWTSADFKSALLNSHIIIHRPYIPTESVGVGNYDEATAETSRMLTTLRQYLIGQNTPSQLIDKMMKLPSNEGYELTRQDESQLGFMAPVLEEKAVKYCGISNNTILTSDDPAKSVLCVQRIQQTLRLPYLAKLIGFQPAIDALQKRMTEMSVLGRVDVEIGESWENMSSARQDAFLYSWCSVAAASLLRQPVLSDDQVVSESFSACEKSQERFSASLVKEQSGNGLSPKERRENVERVIRSQIVKLRHEK